MKATPKAITAQAKTYRDFLRRADTACVIEECGETHDDEDSEQLYEYTHVARTELFELLDSYDAQEERRKPAV